MQTVFAEQVEFQAEVGFAFLVSQSRHGVFDHSAEYLETCFDGRHPTSHQLDGRETTLILQIRFASSRTTARADFVVDV
jgi:hypothetical protein